jgi:hypothetical protein
VRAVDYQQPMQPAPQPQPPKPPIIGVAKTEDVIVLLTTVVEAA